MPGWRRCRGSRGRCLSPRAGGEHHAFGNAKAHLSGREVCEQHHKASLKGVRFVGCANAREHLALAQGPDVELGAEAYRHLPPFPP